MQKEKPPAEHRVGFPAGGSMPTTSLPTTFLLRPENPLERHQDFRFQILSEGLDLDHVGDLGKRRRGLRQPDHLVAGHVELVGPLANFGPFEFGHISDDEQTDVEM